MPKLKQFADCRISLYPRDHQPAHVHVEFRDGDRCTVEIESLNVTGSIRPAAKLVRALEWIESHRASLLESWKEIVR